VAARAGLESGFALLSEKQLPDRNREDLKQPDKARVALAELSGKAERLFIIDNVEDAETVRPRLPREATTGATRPEPCRSLCILIVFLNGGVITLPSPFCYSLRS
jgi:hypothetical protein